MPYLICKSYVFLISAHSRDVVITILHILNNIIARELFMKNTLRVVYDVEGNDWELFPPMVDMKLPSGNHGLGYTDLSMCRLRKFVCTLFVVQFVHVRQ